MNYRRRMIHIKISVKVDLWGFFVLLKANLFPTFCFYLAVK